MTNSFINLSQVTINPNSITYIDWDSTHKREGEPVKTIWVYFIVKTEDYPDAIRFDYHSQDGQILRDFFGRIEGV
jgi:hypothetical protein